MFIKTGQNDANFELPNNLYIINNNYIVNEKKNQKTVPSHKPSRVYWNIFVKLRYYGSIVEELNLTYKINYPSVINLLKTFGYPNLCGRRYHVRASNSFDILIEPNTKFSGSTGSPLTNHKLVYANELRIIINL